MKGEDLSQRTKQFALDVIELVGSLPKGKAADVIGYQVLRSGTSVGANYREAQRARSKADFIAKIGLCEQEMAETLYWLELLRDCSIVSKQQGDEIIDEANQLLAILVTIGKSARRR